MDARLLRPVHIYTGTTKYASYCNAIHIACHLANEKRERMVAVKSSCLPPSCSQRTEAEHGDCITATIEKPLGLVIAEDKSGEVVIESIEPGSNADRLGVFRVGDLLVSCSAIVMAGGKNVGKKEGMYTRSKVKGGCCSTGCPDCPFNARNWVRVQFDCRGESFDSVVAALSSNTNARWMSNYGMKNGITISVVRRKLESIA